MHRRVVFCWALWNECKALLIECRLFLIDCRAFLLFGSNIGLSAPEASWRRVRRVFDPVTLFCFDLYHYLEKNR